MRPKGEAMKCNSGKIAQRAIYCEPILTNSTEPSPEIVTVLGELSIISL